MGTLRKTKLKWPFILTGIVFSLGLLLTAWGFNVLYEYSQDRLRTEIKRRYEAKAEQLQERIDLALESLISIAALYRASDKVSRQAFEIFVQSDAAFHDGTVALGWVPRVSDSDRKEFIKKARKESSARFNIFEVSGHGMPGSFRSNKIYFPIYHLISLEARQLKQGMDLSAVPSKWRAMQAAVKSKNISVTRRVHVYSGDSGYGFQAFLPVPMKSKKDYEGINTISGFAMGQFDISRLLRSIFEEEKDLNITLLDLSARETEQFLYRFGEPEEKEIKIRKFVDLNHLKTPHWKRTFSVGDRQWMAVFQSYNEMSLTNQSWLPYAGVIGGLLITSLISLYLFLAQFRGQQLFISQQKVVKETALKEEAVEENLAKSRFLRAASHDLRQPLNTLSIYTHLLEKKASKDKALTKVIDSIKTSTITLNTMFDALLNLGRLEAGQLQASIVNFKIENLLEKLSEEFATLAKEKGLSFEFKSVSGSVTSDPDLLERILRNLLNNAIRYTSQGQVKLEAIKKGEELRLQIVDTGSGFDKETSKKLFDEFYRGDRQSKEGDKGLGLGLSIVAQTATLLGHEYGASSSTGKGAIFYIDVPFEEDI